MVVDSIFTFSSHASALHGNFWEISNIFRRCITTETPYWVFSSIFYVRWGNHMINYYTVILLWMHSMVSWIYTVDLSVCLTLHTCFRHLPANMSMNELEAASYLQSTSKNNLNEKRLKYLKHVNSMKSKQTWSVQKSKFWLYNFT